jgi:hypothetical protein
MNCPKCGTLNPLMEELVEELMDNVNQACSMHGVLDSCALSAQSWDAAIKHAKGS